MEAIILAGGLGTRLSGVINDVPKCMAPVAGAPFLSHILHSLEQQMFDHVILSLGYKHEVIVDWLRSRAFLFKVSWVIERTPLGTGGGIRRAIGKSREREIFILNGDTMFTLDMHAMRAENNGKHKALVGLKPMKNFERYGAVRLDGHNNITAFEEKQFRESGLINGGVYLLNRDVEDFSSYPEKFSFEKDFLEPEASQGSLKGYVSDAYFIDIGIPEDYYKAQEDFSKN